MLTMPRRSRLKLPPLRLASEESFGDRLARLRKERGYTQVELAAKVGITQSLMTDYERDKLRLNADMICRFAQALGVSSDELLGLSGSSKTKKKEGKHISLKIVRRLQRIEKLPDPQQKKLLQSIDMLLGGATGGAGG